MDVVLYEEPDGTSPVMGYIDAAYESGDRQAAARLERMVDLLEARGPSLGMPHTRIVDRTERLFELRFGPHRVAFIVHDQQIVLLHGWRKTAQKLDVQEATRAMRYARDWRSR